MNNRLLGCISSEENERLALSRGCKSDRAQIAELAAPWDKTSQPEIITWNNAWRKKLEEEAAAFDVLRDSCQLYNVWDIAKIYGKTLSDLCASIQKRNDCTAWGTTRAAVCLTLFQQRFGAEISACKYNPSGIYAYSSGVRAVANTPFPDNGRTIYAIAKAACETGNFPAESIGEYAGNNWFSQRMIDAVPVAEKNQMGFVYLGDERRTAEELADIVILSCRACRPVIIGNTVALQDGTALNSDGVYVSDVRGSWGGGHCTSACDVKKVGDNYYVWIYNSHGPIYPSKDGAPAEGTFVTRQGLIKYLSGSWADVIPTTYIERPREERERDNG